MTDFDGSERSEKDLAVKWDVQGTPSLHFFAGSDPASAYEAGRTKYLKPGEFLEMLRFVRAKAYETMTFAAWLEKNPPKI